MFVSILGAGYVGAVSAACLSDLGTRVLVADLDENKVKRIGLGESPIVETGLESLLKKGVERGLLTATTDVYEAVMKTEASIVCVGTPSADDGSLDLQYVRNVSETIGRAIKEKGTRHTVIMRSTMVPGSMAKVVIPTLEAASGLKAFDDFGVAIYPEFLREGTAIKDFYQAAITLYGAQDDQTIDVLRAINKGLKSKEVITGLNEAEAVKYANNCWHAVKISFSNEVGNIAAAAGVDGTEIMRIVCLDTNLNISPAYMKPGFAFGGSCLPKDLRAFRALAAEIDIPTPIFDATLTANQQQIERAAKLIEASGNQKIAMFGLTFKDDTDDLRESPLISLANLLLERDFDIKIIDSRISEAMKKEEFKAYFEASYPALAARMTDNVDALIDFADTVLYGRKDPETTDAMPRVLQEKYVVDLVRFSPELRTRDKYTGICW